MSDTTERQVAATRVMHAPPERIFELLADPSAHARFDGSGSVQRPRSGAPARLSLGARFGMDMKVGLPYRITNEVVEFEEGRRIAWRHFGHHIWRYELEPVEGGTQVTETFDWRTSRFPPFYTWVRADRHNHTAIVATLDRLAALVEDEGTGA
ncbi:MAG TPA: SRPBCC family protein [Acidimicrobiia bacterium]|nr:SRPBCC family protein [Acidimicrobiia bacterium]